MMPVRNVILHIEELTNKENSLLSYDSLLMTSSLLISSVVLCSDSKLYDTSCNISRV